MRLAHTPLGLHVMGFTTLSAIIDLAFFKRDNQHCFRAVVALPHEQRGIYRLYYPISLFGRPFPETNWPTSAIYVKRIHYGEVQYHSAVAAGYSWIFTGSPRIGISPSLWRPPSESILLVSTRYAVVEGEEECIPEVASGNIQSCTVLDSVVCNPVLSYSQEALQINYNCRIPFRVTKDNILYLRLEHSLQFLARLTDDVWQYILL